MGTGTWRWKSHFYSAREEPDQGVLSTPREEPAAKKPAPKKVTNAIMAEQVAALASLVEALLA